MAPEKVPLNPMLVLAFVPREPLYETLEAVTFCPDWLKVALHPWPTVSPPGSMKPNVQFVIGEPRFVIEMLAVKPPDHEFAVYATWHPLAALAVEERLTTATVAATSTPATVAVVRSRTLSAGLA